MIHLSQFLRRIAAMPRRSRELREAQDDVKFLVALQGDLLDTGHGVSPSVTRHIGEAAGRVVRHMGSTRGSRA